MRWLLACVTVTLTSAAVTAADPDKEAKLPNELARALKQLTAADSYSFQTAPQGKKENGVEGKYQKGEPVSFKADQVEFFKKGDKLVYKQGDQWQRTKTGVESDPLRILAPSAKVRETVLPHEELQDLAKLLTGTIDAAGASGQPTAYTGTLTLDGCRKLLLPADQSLAKRGTIILKVDDDGNLVQYDIAIDIEGKRGNADVKGTVSRIVKLSDIGKTKAAAPDAARKALE
jgi:hypothetical protein